jgi:hypothetical protein
MVAGLDAEVVLHSMTSTQARVRGAGLLCMHASEARFTVAKSANKAWRRWTCVDEVAADGDAIVQAKDAGRCGMQASNPLAHLMYWPPIAIFCPWALHHDLHDADQVQYPGPALGAKNILAVWTLTGGLAEEGKPSKILPRISPGQISSAQLQSGT